MAYIYGIYAAWETLTFVTVAEIIGTGSTAGIARTVGSINSSGRYGCCLCGPSVIGIKI